MQQISFARTRSDAVVKRLDAEHYEEHRQRRLQHKSVYLRCRPIVFMLTRIPPLCYPEATRYTNPLKRKFRAQRLAAESGHTTSFCDLRCTHCHSFFFLKPQRTAPRSLHPEEPRSRCPTNICRRTKFYSYRICPRVSAKTNLWRSSHSEYRFSFNGSSPC
jgi:hypothetical protein